MKTTFVRDPDAIRQLEQDPELQKQLVAAAQQVAAGVRAAAPAGGTGAFARSISATYVDGRPAVASRDSFVHLIEWGSVNNPPYSPFRIGVRTAGLRFADASR